MTPPSKAPSVDLLEAVLQYTAAIEHDEDAATLDRHLETMTECAKRDLAKSRAVPVQSGDELLIEAKVALIAFVRHPIQFTHDVQLSDATKLARQTITLIDAALEKREG